MAQTPESEHRYFTPERQLHLRRNVSRWKYLYISLELVAQVVGLVLDIHLMSVVQQPVQQSSSQHIVAEQLAPVNEVLVTGQNHAAVFVPL